DVAGPVQQVPYELVDEALQYREAI
ncbi:MAG: hypothetical protein QOC92_2279, partial [Acidimicrobiaceae bacterium]